MSCDHVQILPVCCSQEQLSLTEVLRDEAMLAAGDPQRRAYV